VLSAVLKDIRSISIGEKSTRDTAVYMLWSLQKADIMVWQCSFAFFFWPFSKKKEFHVSSL
jgi:hypothetical protein